MLISSISAVSNTNFNFNFNFINPRFNLLRNHRTPPSPSSLSSSSSMRLILTAATTLTTFAVIISNNVRTSHSFCTTTTNYIKNNNALLRVPLSRRRPIFTSSPYYSSSYSPSSSILLSSAAAAGTTTTMAPSMPLSPSPSPTQEAAASSQQQSFQFHPNLKGVFAGSGTDGLSDPRMVNTILDLLPSSSKEKLNNARDNKDKVESDNIDNDVNVLYIGTATYDIPAFKLKQTKCFIKRGCKVQSLNVAFDDNNDNSNNNNNNKKKNKLLIENADIIVVGGGNTLFAVDRWNTTGLIPTLKLAMERGCILTGGSAGAICWFHSGHSDSADPDSYVNAMLQRYGNSNDDNDADAIVSCSTSFDINSPKKKKKKEWNYIRVPGLNFIPNVICCPHHDKVQSNGLLRSNDFDTMLLKLAANNQTATQAQATANSNIIGIGIDHYAALIVDGDDYRVFSLQDKVGSIPTETNTTCDEKKKDDFAVNDTGIATGTPGIWIKRTMNNKNNGNGNKNSNFIIDAQILPLEGKLKDIINIGISSGSAVVDIDDIDTDNNKKVERCRTENPSS
jgi:dipeptidase E